MSDVKTFQQAKKMIDMKVTTGYIRKIEQHFPFENGIPVEIIKICIEYYHIPSDRFDPILHSEAIDITDNNIAEAVHYMNGDLHNIFLSHVVNSGNHHWTFKIIKHDDDDHYIYIGIWNNESDPKIHLDDWPQNHSTDDGKPSFYGVNMTYGELRGGSDDETDWVHDTDEYCDAVKTGDIVHMYLDLDKYELSYAINDEHYGIAFNVESGQSYRGIISLEHTEAIQLVSYE